MSFKAVMIYLLLTVVAVLTVVIGREGGEAIRAASAEPVKAREYVPIGNGIRRTDDHEKGISCYVAAGGSMSCVKVNP